MCSLLSVFFIYFFFNQQSTMKMALTAIQRILQSVEAIFFYQNPTFHPTCHHNLRERPHHNVSPRLILSSSCHRLQQTPSPDPPTATLSHTRPLSLSFLMIIQKRSVPTHRPITHLHLSILASRSCWKDQERAQAQLQRDRPLTHLQPNDTPSP